MPPKPAVKKTTTPAKAPAKGATKGAPAAKGGATKGAAASKGSAAPAGGATKEPEKKAEPKVIKKVLVPEEIGLKQIATVLAYGGEAGEKFKESKRWLYIIDRNGNVGTFLKYRDTNMIQAASPEDFQPERIRMALMGALRFGKPCIIDISGADQEGIMNLLIEKMNELCKGLWEDLMDRSILDFEKCSRMSRDSDDGEYHNRYDYRTQDFLFAILSDVDPPSTAMEDFFPVIIN